MNSNSNRIHQAIQTIKDYIKSFLLPLLLLHLPRPSSILNHPPKLRTNPPRNKNSNNSHHHNPPRGRHQRPRENIPQKRIQDQIHSHRLHIPHQRLVRAEIVRCRPHPQEKHRVRRRRGVRRALPAVDRGSARYRIAIESRV